MVGRFDAGATVSRLPGSVMPGCLLGGAMLPDLRAVIAATIAIFGLLMIAFGAVAAFRVAQASHGALQADLTRRVRMAELPPVRRPIVVIDTPGPHIAPFPPLPVVEVKDAPVATELHDVPAPVADVAPATPSGPVATPQAIATPEPTAPPQPVAALPPEDAPIGGPLAEPKPMSDAERTAARAERDRKLAAAKRAYAARVARQRRLAAARRAAEARARQQQAQQSAILFNPLFGNSDFNRGAGN
jgi:hypothetical protein